MRNTLRPQFCALRRKRHSVQWSLLTDDNSKALGVNLPVEFHIMSISTEKALSCVMKHIRKPPQGISENRWATR